MDEETLKALKGSIKKWEAIVAGTGTDDGWANCPLCLMFLRVNGTCSGCPVFEKTGSFGCEDTPYELYSNADEVGEEDKMPEYAQGELDFLKSLLPESERE